MSYCRFSSEDFSCDIYLYESEFDNYVLHVAGNRVVGDVPKLKVLSTRKIKEDEIQEYFVSLQKQKEFLEKAERKKIDLPYAGETFYFDDIEEVILKLEELKKLGYNFPDYVIPTLKEEEHEK